MLLQTACGLAPLAARARATIAGAPSPIMRFTCGSDSAGCPRSRSIWFSAACRSGALSTSVPSRSNTSRKRLIATDSSALCYKFAMIFGVDHGAAVSDCTSSEPAMSQSRFAAIILAAGNGTRMKSAMPKVMHPIAGHR